MVGLLGKQLVRPETVEKRSLSRLVLLDIIGLTGFVVCGLASPRSSRKVWEVRGVFEDASES